jgi:hypothetical protein
VTLVYHYTDSGGLLGIIESHAFRATNVWFMNDSAEATYGLDRAEEFLTSKSPSSALEKDVIQVALRALGGVRRLDSLPDSYITCFSEKENDLSQWRAYGRGKGFSIGFDSEELEELSKVISKGHLPNMRRVAYTESAQNYILQTNYQQQVLNNLASDSDAGTLAGVFMVMAIMAAPSLKHPAFEAEDEWRLHFFFERITDKVKFRNGAMGLTPYIEMSLCSPGSTTIAAIREIRVGPQRHPAEAQRAAQQLLARNGMSTIEVKPATIPLRPD